MLFVYAFGSICHKHFNFTLEFSIYFNNLLHKKNIVTNLISILLIFDFIKYNTKLYKNKQNSKSILNVTDCKN